MNEFKNSWERQDSITDSASQPLPLQVFDLNNEKFDAPSNQSAQDFLSLCQVGLFFDNGEGDEKKAAGDDKKADPKKAEGEPASKKDENSISDLKNDFVWAQFQKTVSSQVKILDKRIDETSYQFGTSNPSIVKNVDAILAAASKQCVEKSPLKFNMEFGFKQNIEDVAGLKKQEQALLVTKACTMITSGTDENIKNAESTLVTMVKDNPSLQKSPEFHELILKSYGQMAQVRAARGLKPWVFSGELKAASPTEKTDKSAKEYLKSASDKFYSEGMKGAVKDFDSAKSAAEADKSQINKERMSAFAKGLAMNIEIVNADTANKPVDQLLDDRLAQINQERQMAGKAANADLLLSAVKVNTAFAKIASGDDKYQTEGFGELKSTWSITPEIALEPGFFEHLHQAVEANTKVAKKEDSENPLGPGKDSPLFKGIKFDDTSSITASSDLKVESHKADDITTVVLTAIGFGLAAYTTGKLMNNFRQKKEAVEQHGVKPLKAAVADASGKPTALKTLGTTSDTSMVVLQDPTKKNDFKTSGDKGIAVSENFDPKKQNYDGYQRLIADGRDFFVKENKVYVEQKGRMFETKELHLLTQEQFRAGVFPPVEKPAPTVRSSLDPKSTCDVVILHFNDVHSRGLVNGELSAMTALIKQRAEQLQKEGKFVLVVQGGDEYSGSTVSNFTGKGLVENQIIQEMKNLTKLPFVQIIGNHAIDGAGKEIKHLVDIAKQTGGTFAVANVEFSKQPGAIGEGQNFQPYRVVEAQGPNNKTIKIAVIGLTTHELEAKDVTFKYDVLIGKNKEQIASIAKMVDQALKTNPQNPVAALPPREQTTVTINDKPVDLLEYFRKENLTVGDFTARRNEFAHFTERGGQCAEGTTFTQADTYIHAAWDQVEIARQNGVSKIIIASHLGLAQEQLVASRVPGVALVIGAHSHDAVQAPIMVKNVVTGEMVAVTQAGCKANFVGETVVKYGGTEFAVTGNLHDIQKIKERMLNGEMTKETAQKMLKFIQERKVGGVADEKAETVLSKIVELVDSTEFGVDPKKPPVVTGTFNDADIRKGETSIGNLTADAMRAALNEYRASLKDGKQLNGFLKHMGDVREAFTEGTKLNGFTLSEVFCNGRSQELVVMKVTPRMLRDILEFGVGDLPGNNKTAPHDYSGNLLTPSGMKVEYDTSAEGAELKAKATDAKNAEAPKPGLRVRKISVIDPETGSYKVVWDAATMSEAKLAANTELLEIGTLAHPVEKWAKAGVFSDHPEFKRLLDIELAKPNADRKTAHELAGFALVGVSDQVVKLDEGWRSKIEIIQPTALGRYLTGKLPPPSDVSMPVKTDPDGTVEVSPRTTGGVDGRFVDLAPARKPPNFGDTIRGIADHSKLDTATALEQSTILAIRYKGSLGTETTKGFDKYSLRFESNAQSMLGKLADTSGERLEQLNNVLKTFLADIDPSGKNPLAKDAKIVVDNNVASGGKIVFKQTHDGKVIEPVFFDNAHAYVLRGTGELAPIPLKNLQVELIVSASALAANGPDRQLKATEVVSTLFHQLSQLDQMSGRVERAKNANLLADNRVANIDALHALLESEKGRTDLSADFLQYRLNGNSLNGVDRVTAQLDPIEVKKAIAEIRSGERLIPSVDAHGSVKLYLIDSKKKGFKEVTIKSVDELFDITLTDIECRIKLAKKQGDTKTADELSARRKQIQDEQAKCANPEYKKAANGRMAGIIRSAPGTITTVLFLTSYVIDHADKQK